MIIDGRSIAQEILREVQNTVSHLSHKPHAVVITCAPNFETKKYLNLKLKKAKEAGVQLSVIEFPSDTVTDEIVSSVKNICMQTDAIIVQLPLPSHIDTKVVLEAIPVSYDADGMHFDGTKDTLMSPVVGAIAEMVSRHDILLANKNVVVVGHGVLVGKPAADYARVAGASVTVLTKESTNINEVISKADVLILGAGVPNLIKPEMVKRGVVIFDAGTSEEGGVLVGDADKDCAKVASFMTPVPGGIGPITVSILLRNIVYLATAK